MLHPKSSRAAFIAQNIELRELLEKARFQMQRDYALKKLMDKENQRLRQRLFDKSNKPQKKQRSGLARHMTAEENLDDLAYEEWKSAMKEVLKSDVFKERRKAYDEYCKQKVAEEKEAEKARKEADKEREQKGKEEERQRVQEEKSLEKDRKKLEREMLKRAKAEAVAAVKAQKLAEKASKGKGKAAPKRRKPQVWESDDDDGEEVPEVSEDDFEQDKVELESEVVLPVAKVPKVGVPRRRTRQPPKDMATELQDMGPRRSTRRR